jgi:hypothetical protein
MANSLLPAAALLGVLVAQAAGGEGKGEPPALRYTVRTEQGDRSWLDRAAVLKTLKLSAERARAWAED